MSVFDNHVISAVTGHMNDDHPEDNLLIARAFGYPDATESTMTGLSDEVGIWRVVDANGEHDVSVAWPGGPISERPEIRREVVALYHAACEKLGVPAREEHQPAAPSGHGSGEASGGHHGGTHPHGAGASGGEEAGEKPFSQLIREGSWADHSQSEGAGFMEDIMRMRASLDDYIALVVQHFYMYEALEEVADRFAGDPAFAPFHPPALARLRTIEADLEHLIGSDWRDRIEATPATRDYAARIREVGDEGWIPGLVAHHYTRYLGDLSGGQMIARRVSKQHGFEEAGAAFYAFPELGDLAEFKDGYRASLDTLGAGLSEEERARMLDEVRRAYAFNTAVFVDLSRARTVAA